MSSYLSPADWGVIVVYLLGIVAFGVWCGRGQRTTRDYFLGSKNLSWWGVSLSILATETSALTFISIPAAAYAGGLYFIQIVIGYVIARVILAVVMVPHYFKGEIYSPYQLIAQAFGPAARRTAASFFLIAGTLAAGVRVYVTCIPIDLIMGEQLARIFGDPIVGAILLFVGLSLVYTYVGGIRAVIWTDAVQFVLLAGGGLFALFYIPSLLEGGIGGAFTEARSAGKLNWLDTEFRLHLPHTLWMGLIGATVMVMATHGADQLIVQRVLTCKSIADGRKALALSAVVILPLFLLFLMVGAMLWVFYQHASMAIPLPEGRAGFGKNDYIFPIFIISEMPPIVRGFLIVAIFSAAMSSVSSALSALASVSTMDIMRGLRAGRSESFYFAFSKYTTIFWAVMLVFVAYMSREVRLVLDWAFSLNGLTNGAILGALGLALFWRRGSPWPIVSGMLVSLVSMIFISQYTWTREVGGEVVTYKVGWPWFTLIGTTLMVLTAIVVSQILKRISHPRQVPEPLNSDPADQSSFRS
jgi:solute:Na+ symporter, SSS family